MPGAAISRFGELGKERSNTSQGEKMNLFDNKAGRSALEYKERLHLVGSGE